MGKGKLLEPALFLDGEGEAAASSCLQVVLFGHPSWYAMLEIEGVDFFLYVLDIFPIPARFHRTCPNG